MLIGALSVKEGEPVDINNLVEPGATAGARRAPIKWINWGNSKVQSKRVTVITVIGQITGISQFAAVIAPAVLRRPHR